MPRRSPLIAFAACFALLASQLSGLHVHAGADGFDGVPQGAHFHGSAPGYGELASGDELHEGTLSLHAHAHTHDHSQERDHAGDRDVSIVELGAASKLLVFIVWLGFGLLLILRGAPSLRPSTTGTHLKTRPGHWRPPLRAPPVASR